MPRQRRFLADFRDFLPRNGGVWPEHPDFPLRNRGFWPTFGIFYPSEMSDDPKIGKVGLYPARQKDNAIVIRIPLF
ncbi:hypothetical protein [uncultured Bacteroides sp.]|uniref:hypothetical protein n=1 Tax=uncultured Bacteroides sp. TaxID=162156 RepID=UPI00260DEB03|nr:hypothetical protein [uncultured Bacteroides sp.]